MELGFFLRFFDIVLAHVARVLDGNRLLLASTLVFGGDIEDTVGINIESHFDLRNATWCWRNTVEDKSAQRFVVLSKLTLALQDVDLNLRLIVAGRREGF